jgi:hypothetical protein
VHTDVKCEQKYIQNHGKNPLPRNKQNPLFIIFRVFEASGRETEAIFYTHVVNSIKNECRISRHVIDSIKNKKILKGTLLIL